MKVHPLKVNNVAEQEKQDTETSHLHNKNETVPPDVEACLRHQSAKKLKKPNLDAGQFCECCGFPTEGEPIGLCANVQEYGFLGEGYPMFFQFVLFCIFFMVILGIIQSIYATVQNKLGKTCEYYRTSLSSNDRAYQCRDNIANIYSTSNRKADDYDKVFGLLNLITTVVLSFFTLFYRKKQQKLKETIDESNIEASDFTLMISNLPDCTDEELRNFLIKLGEGSLNIEVKKIVHVYKIESLLTKRQEKYKLIKVLSKTTDKSTQEYQKISQKHDQVESELKDLEENSKNGLLEKGNIVFISLGHDTQLLFVVERLKLNILERVLANCMTLDKSFKGNILYCSRAHQPDEIFWEHLLVPNNQRLLRKAVTVLLSLIVLGVCLVIIYFISLYQDNLQKVQNDSEQATKTNYSIEILGIIASIFIIIINNVITICIKYFCKWEKNKTYTNYLISVIKKLGLAQFINTAVLTYLVNKTVNANKFMIDGGLNYDVQIIFLCNMVLPSFFNVFDIMYFYRLFKRLIIKSQDKDCKMTQQEANSYFEDPVYDLSSSYANITKTMMLGCFYAYIFPLGVYMSILGLIISYWTQKILLRSRYATPTTVSHALAEAMTDFYLELFIAIFCVGCLVMEQEIFGQIQRLTIAQAVVSGCFYILPIDKILCFLQVKREVTQEHYDGVSHLFLTDYDRSNPATMSQGMEEWIRSLQQKQSLHQSEQPQQKGQLKQAIQAILRINMNQSEFPSNFNKPIIRMDQVFGSNRANFSILSFAKNFVQVSQLGGPAFQSARQSNLNISNPLLPQVNSNFGQIFNPMMDQTSYNGAKTMQMQQFQPEIYNNRR